MRERMSDLFGFLLIGFVMWCLASGFVWSFIEIGKMVKGLLA